MGDKGEQCCKKCVVSKFKYIIEKYVKNIDINLPGPIHFKLLSIYNELQIKDPTKRFVKISNIKNKPKKMERDRSGSKSKSKFNILSKIKRPKSISIVLSKKSNPSTPKRSSILEEDEVIKNEEKEQENADIVDTNTKTFKLKNVFKSRSVNQQSTISSNTHDSINIVPINSFSPTIIIPNAEHKMDEIVSISNNNQSNKQSIHSNVSNTSNDTEILTPTEIEDETDEPLPNTPKKESKSESAATTTTTNSNSTSTENANNNESKDKEEEVKEIENEMDPNDDDDSKEEEVDNMTHNGFGNINYLTVFDDAILEILKLIKSDTWRRFRRSKQFLDWVSNFKPS